MKKYNLVVIGAGAGGLVSAYIAAAVKAKVALIEKNKMGGDCLNTGCVPSKALLKTASFLTQVKNHAKYGVHSAHADFDFAQVMERVQEKIKKIEPHDSIERYTSLGVECYQGEAEILSPTQVQIDGGEILETKNIVVASGGVPRIIDIPGLDQEDLLHTENVWHIREQPKNLIVIGGGPIGCELGQSFARLGSQVSVVHRDSELLPREDADVSEVLKKAFLEDGGHLYLSSEIIGAELKEGKKVLNVKTPEGIKSIEYDKVLMAIGRVPATNRSGLRNVGVELESNGLIKIDAFGRTSVKNIYAVGDAASRYQFTHVAAHMAWYAAVNSLFSPLKKFKIDWSTIPWCTYTDPEIARIGLNEKDAKMQGIPYEKSVYPLDDLDRAITDSEEKGFVKVLTVPGKDKILGATICGARAGDLITEFVTAMKQGLGLNTVLGTIHIYPTMAEANKFAAGVWKKANAPEGLLKWIEKFHTWRR